MNGDSFRPAPRPTVAQAMTILRETLPALMEKRAWDELVKLQEAALLLMFEPAARRYVPELQATIATVRDFIAMEGALA